MSNRERTLATLRLAIHLSQPGERATTPYFGVTYYFGDKAYGQWANDLRQLEYPADAEQPRPDTPEIYDLSTMVYQAEQIVRGRSAAPRFCYKAAETFPVAAGQLRAAARAYGDEVAIAENALAPFLSGDEKQWQAWLSDEAKRESGVSAIRRMLDCDSRAVAGIGVALKFIEEAEVGR